MESNHIVTPVIVNIYVLCYNEEVLLPHMVFHYKKYLPNCSITIYDNESTDNSVEVAKSLGCEVISWSSGGINDTEKKRNIHNNCWKDAPCDWIICADMDEWLCITEADLNLETVKKTSILKIQGYEMVGTSTTIDLNDVDLHKIDRCYPNKMESKHLCFNKKFIEQIGYDNGNHGIKPIGNIVYSDKIYANKHMSALGLPFFMKKNKSRFVRCEAQRKKRMSTHYKDNTQEIERMYKNFYDKSKIVTSLF